MIIIVKIMTTSRSAFLLFLSLLSLLPLLTAATTFSSSSRQLDEDYYNNAWNKYSNYYDTSTAATTSYPTAATTSYGSNTPTPTTLSPTESPTRSSGSSNLYGLDVIGSNFFVDSQNTYYDAYQTAWRYLGHLVKCGYPSDRYDDDNESGSREKSHDSDEGRYRGNNYCQRFLLWAAYADPNYQGGGIGEYQYFDTSSQSWDTSACELMGDSRCAPMDCHLSNTTTWKLLGVYKEAEYYGNDAFFEQLFKHEGICVWNDEDLYDFMSNARQYAWPEGCVETPYNGLYLDLKPTLNGNMTYGLYTDYICKTEYTDSSPTVDTVAKSMGLLYGSNVDKWNDALEVYKVCQPCKAYNLKVTDPYSSNYRYSDGGNGRRRRRGMQEQDNRNLYNDDYYSDPNQGYFQCDDDADYTNVNQCMKFRSHAELEVASWEDLVIATEQGGMLELKVGGTLFGKEKLSAEQQKYLEKLWAKQRAAEQAEYQALLKTVPSAKPMLAAGRFCIVMGPLSLVAALWWACCRKRSNGSGASSSAASSSVSESFREPLVSPEA